MKIWAQRIIKANDILNYIVLIKITVYSVKFSLNAHMKFSQLIMSAISSSQWRMDEKLAQFQEEVRLGQVEATAKALKIAH